MGGHICQIDTSSIWKLLNYIHEKHLWNDDFASWNMVCLRDDVSMEKRWRKCPALFVVPRWRILTNKIYWLVVRNINFIFPYIGLRLSSQLTNKNIFQRGGPGPPTKFIIDHQGSWFHVCFHLSLVTFSDSCWSMSLTMCPARNLGVPPVIHF